MIAKTTHLDGVVGQPNVRFLKAYVANQNRASKCFLLEGEPGIGKSLTAQCVARDLGCFDYMSGLYVVPASELSIDMCRELFERTFHQSLLFGGRWKTLIIEELDGVVSKAVERYLKVELERLPDNVTVIATSNNAAGMDSALLERFRYLVYESGPGFEDACLEHIARVWESKFSTDLPSGWRTWGVQQNRFSMRTAWRRLREEMELQQMGVC